MSHLKKIIIKHKRRLLLSKNVEIIVYANYNSTTKLLYRDLKFFIRASPQFSKKYIYL